MKQLNRSKNWPFLLAVLLLASLLLNVWPVSPASASQAVSQPPQNFEAFFDTTLQAQMNADHIVGATVAVVQDGELAFAKGYGYADLEAGIPVQASESLFFIGSDGKLFTWTAVLQLAEQGKLDLHADVNSYLDFEIPAAFGEPITLHHLMTHTAGFEENMNALLRDDPDQVLPLRAFLLAHMPQRVYPPGKVSAYSNYGTALAGYIVERVSGQSYEAYLAEHLLQPLGMMHSTVGHALPPELSSQLSKGYQYQNGTYSRVDFEWTSATPCAPVRTTAVDLSRFMIAQLANGCVDGACILRPETLKQMHQPQFTHHPQMSGMAYGYLDTRINGHRILWHMGESARFTTVFALIPEQNLGLMVSYNTPPVNDRAILFSFMDAFLPANRTPLSEQPLAGWEARAQQINGTYVAARSAHTTAQIFLRSLAAQPVMIENGVLTFNGWRFVETEPAVFQQVDGDRVLAFEQDANGQRWLYVGPLAYFQVPWYQTPIFLLLVGGLCLLAFLSAWVIWPVRALRLSVKHLPNPGRAALWLSAGLGLFDFGLFAWFLVLMVQFGDRFVYPQAAVELIAGLYWLAVPWTLAVLVLAVRAWQNRRWTAAGRIHYSLVAFAAAAFLWLIYSFNLLGGRL